MKEMTIRAVDLKKNGESFPMMGVLYRDKWETIIDEELTSDSTVDLKGLNLLKATIEVMFPNAYSSLQNVGILVYDSNNNLTFNYYVTINANAEAYFQSYFDAENGVIVGYGSFANNGKVTTYEYSPMGPVLAPLNAKLNRFYLYPYGSGENVIKAGTRIRIRGVRA